MAKKNPILQKKFEEGYAKGYEAGMKIGIANTVDFFIERLKKLFSMRGVGPKMTEKIIQAIGKEYFKEIKK